MVICSPPPSPKLSTCFMNDPFHYFLQQYVTKLAFERIFDMRKIESLVHKQQHTVCGEQYKMAALHGAVNRDQSVVFDHDKSPYCHG